MPDLFKLKKNLTISHYLTIKLYLSNPNAKIPIVLQDPFILEK